MVLKICWLLLAALHALPALAFVRPQLIERLYGAVPGAPEFLLLHHRAALFLAVVAMCIWAAFDPAARRVATIVVAISMASFVGLWLNGGSPSTFRTIAVADIAGLIVLAYAGWRAFN